MLTAAASADTLKCNETLKGILEKENITGMSVGIEQNGNVLYEFAESDGKPNDFSKDTPLRVASITKIMTSTLLIRLVEEGKLSLYDNVRQHIPEFPFDDVQVLHLMTHTSGLYGSYTTFEEGRRDNYAKVSRVFSLDTDFKYYSAGYNILGDIIERQSCMKFESYAEKIIFAPLEMTHTKMTPGIAESGMVSTAGDLLKFSRHILNARKDGKAGILTVAGLDLMFREHTRGRYDRTPVFFIKSQTRRFSRYFGDLNSEESVGHAGSSGCFLLLDPKYDVSIVILTNGSNTIQNCDENFARINNLLMGKFVR